MLKRVGEITKKCFSAEILVRDSKEYRYVLADSLSEAAAILTSYGHNVVKIEIDREVIVDYAKKD